jgi:hypothetical protein
VNPTGCRAAVRFTVFLVAAAIVAWTTSACGSGSVATSARQAAQAASSVASEAKSTVARTATQTVTKIASGKTVTEKATPAAPAQTTSISNKTANVNATHVTNPLGSEGQSGGGLPWWAWLLIVVAAGAIAIMMFMLGRRRRQASGQGSGRGRARDAAPPSGAAVRASGAVSVAINQPDMAAGPVEPVDQPVAGPEFSG